MKKENVTHRGVIISISDHTLTLRTDEECRCEGCAVVALCNKNDSSEGETLSIDVEDPTGYAVGERVEAVASTGSTLLATLWALVIPTVLFIGVILGVRFGWPESGAWSILAGFIALAVYDGFLYMARRRIASRVRWDVRRL